MRHKLPARDDNAYDARTKTIPRHNPPRGNPLPTSAKQAQIDAGLQVYSKTPEDMIWANNNPGLPRGGVGGTPKFVIGGASPNTGANPGLGISARNSNHLGGNKMRGREYQIRGLGAPQQRFYYAGMHQPAGVRAPPQNNLGIARRTGVGVAHNDPGLSPLKLLFIGAIIYAVGSFGGGMLGFYAGGRRGGKRGGKQAGAGGGGDCCKAKAKPTTKYCPTCAMNTIQTPSGCLICGSM